MPKLTPEMRAMLKETKEKEKKYEEEQRKKILAQREKEHQERIEAYEPLNFKKDEKEIDELLNACRLPPTLAPTRKLSYSALDTPDVSIHVDVKDNVTKAINNMKKLSDQIYMCNEVIELATGRMDDFIHLFSRYVKSRNQQYVPDDYPRFDCKEFFDRYPTELTNETMKTQCNEYEKYLSKLKEVLPEALGSATKHMTKLVDEDRKVRPVSSMDIDRADMNRVYTEATNRWNKIKNAPYHYLGVP